MGNIYSANLRVSENRIEAYSWYALAAAQGDENVATLRDDVSAVMGADELAEASRRAKAHLNDE